MENTTYSIVFELSNLLFYAQCNDMTAELKKYAVEEVERLAIECGFRRNFKQP